MYIVSGALTLRHCLSSTATRISFASAYDGGSDILSVASPSPGVPSPEIFVSAAATFPV